LPDEPAALLHRCLRISHQHLVVVLGDLRPYLRLLLVDGEEFGVVLSDGGASAGLELAPGLGLPAERQFDAVLLGLRLGQQDVVAPVAVDAGDGGDRLLLGVVVVVGAGDEQDGDPLALALPLPPDHLLLEVLPLPRVEVQLHLEELREDLDHRRVQVCEFLLPALEVEQHLLPAFAKGGQFLAAHQDLGHWRMNGIVIIFPH
jgi:hypothetical protein